MTSLEPSCRPEWEGMRAASRRLQARDAGKTLLPRLTRIFLAISLAAAVISCAPPKETGDSAPPDSAAPAPAAGCASKAPLAPTLPMIRLEDLDLSLMRQSWARPQAGRSVNGLRLRIGGANYLKGVGTHAASRMTIALHGAAIAFHAEVGVDDEISTSTGAGTASVIFRVYVDRKKVFDSGVLRAGDRARRVDVDLAGASRLDLIVHDAGDGIDYDHADWANAWLVLDPAAKARPEALAQPPLAREIRTPRPGLAPRVNAPAVIGAGPRREFVWTLPVAGARPIQIRAEGLPEGLRLDPATGIIRGATGDPGEFEIRAIAENYAGRHEKTFRLVIGQGLALTPPLGWNNWNCWGPQIDDAKIRAAADAMVTSGLARYGWLFINVDDCWQGERDPQTGRIRPNANFPDMKALADFIHERGLRFGVYTDAGPRTCAGFEGSLGREELDARTYAEWGVDYVKEDWCNTGDMDPAQAYALMGRALEATGRDIVFSVCNWGVNEPWAWARQAGGHLWRTTGDIADNWPCVRNLWTAQEPLAAYAGPGGWNDPDMLVVGKMGWGPPLRDSKLTPNEQYSHMTAWVLLAAPLLLGCDLTQLDDFTLNLLTNGEVLAVHQDPLGRQARRAIQSGDFEVWVKDLAGGAKAVGVFEVGDHDLGLEEDARFVLDWKAAGLEGGAWNVRDLWRQRNLGACSGSMAVSLGEHGAELFLLTRAGAGE